MPGRRTGARVDQLGIAAGGHRVRGRRRHGLQSAQDRDARRAGGARRQKHRARGVAVRSGDVGEVGPRRRRARGVGEARRVQQRRLAGLRSAEQQPPVGHREEVGVVARVRPRGVGVARHRAAAAAYRRGREHLEVRVVRRRRAARLVPAGEDRDPSVGERRLGRVPPALAHRGLLGPLQRPGIERERAVEPLEVADRRTVAPVHRVGQVPAGGEDLAAGEQRLPRAEQRGLLERPVPVDVDLGRSHLGEAAGALRGIPDVGRGVVDARLCPRIERRAAPEQHAPGRQHHGVDRVGRERDPGRLPSTDLIGRAVYESGLASRGDRGPRDDAASLASGATAPVGAGVAQRTALTRVLGGVLGAQHRSLHPLERALAQAGGTVVSRCGHRQAEDHPDRQQRRPWRLETPHRPSVAAAGRRAAATRPIFDARRPPGPSPPTGSGARPRAAAHGVPSQPRDRGPRAASASRRPPLARRSALRARRARARSARAPREGPR